jgi:hypothetical protein
MKGQELCDAAVESSQLLTLLYVAWKPELLLSALCRWLRIIVAPRCLGVWTRLTRVESILGLLSLGDLLLALLENLLHPLDVFDDVVERVSNCSDNLVTVIFSAVLPDSVHELRIDLFELFERAT